jgi:hypothetical protein
MLRDHLNLLDDLLALLRSVCPSTEDILSLVHATLRPLFLVTHCYLLQLNYVEIFDLLSLLESPLRELLFGLFSQEMILDQLTLLLLPATYVLRLLLLFEKPHFLFNHFINHLKLYAVAP